MRRRSPRRSRRPQRRSVGRPDTRPLASVGSRGSPRRPEARMVRPQRVPVRALAIALGVATVLLVHAPAPAAAWSDVAFPTQSLGDRGTDVSAVQLLLRARGLVLPADGVFGPSTVTAVEFFEEANGQVAHGVVDRWAGGRLAPARP